MGKKPRVVKVLIYVKFNEFKALQGVNIGALQNALRQYISRKGNGKDCLAFVAVVPTFAASNFVQVELAALNEKIDFVNDTNASDGIASLIDDFFDLDFDGFIVRQIEDSIAAEGNF